MAFGDVILSFAAPSTASRGIAFDGKNLFVSDRNANRVYSIDRKTGSIVNSFSIALIDTEARGMCFDGKYLWMLGNQNTLLYCLDPITGEVIRTLTTNRPPGFDGKSLVGVHYAGGLFEWIDRKEDCVTRAVNIGTRRATVTFDGKHFYTIYDNFAGNPEILEQRDSDADLIRQVNISEGCCDLCFDGKSLWVTNYTTNTILCISRC